MDHEGKAFVEKLAAAYPYMTEGQKGYFTGAAETLLSIHKEEENSADDQQKKSYQVLSGRTQKSSLQLL